MKKSVFLTLSILFVYSVQAQNPWGETSNQEGKGSLSASSVVIGFASSATGNHIRLGYRTSFSENSKWMIGGGIKYLLYVDIFNGTGEIYFKRFYGESFAQNLGLYIEGSRQIFQLPDNVKVYVKFDAQINKTGVKNEYHQIYNVNPDGVLEARLVSYRTDPFLNMETSFAIGLDAKLTNRLAFFVESGLGLVYVFDVPEPLFDNFEWFFSPIVNVGLRYQFSKKK